MKSARRADATKFHAWLSCCLPSYASIGRRRKRSTPSQLELPFGTSPVEGTKDGRPRAAPNISPRPRRRFPETSLDFIGRRPCHKNIAPTLRIITLAAQRIGRTMSQISVETVTSSAILGEGPHWDSTENVLYYVDIIAKEVRKYDPATKRETIAKLDGDSVSFIIPVEGKHNEFLIGHGHHVCLMTWDGESDKPQKIEKLVAVDEEDYNATNSLNDGKADASGRLWAGTLGDFDSFSKGPKGSLYSFPKIRNASKHVGEITCSNGLAWSRDNKVFYYIDTWTHNVDAFDFDIKNGVISNRRTVFDFSANGIKGLPDGMTIDTNDKLWVACFSGSQVIQIDPENGKVLRSIPIPSPQVTSVAFGGPNLDELYVTSGAMNMTPEDKAKYPLAGCTYLIKGIDAKGLPMNFVKL